MKKLIALALALLMAMSFALVGCDGKGSVDTANTYDTVDTDNPEEVARVYSELISSGELEKADGFQLVHKQQYYEIFAKYEELSLGEYLDYYYDVGSMEEYWSTSEKKISDELESKYGKDVKCTVQNVQAKELSSDEVDSLKENYGEFIDPYYGYRLDELNVDISKVEAASRMMVTVELSGSKSSGTDDLSLLLVKYDGKWKFFNL